MDDQETLLFAGFAGEIYGGLGVTSTNCGALNTAVFDSVSITGPDAASGAANLAIRGTPAAQTFDVSTSGGLWCKFKICAIPRSGSPGSIETRAMQPVRLARSSASLPSVHRVYRFYTALS
jgi:hypothetical protein